MIVAIAMARNEGPYIGDVIDHLWANGVDTIVVEDGTSTDDTVEVCVAKGCQVVAETHREYDQPERMHRLASDWCAIGDWMIPFDADEFWCGETGTLAEVLGPLDATKCWAHMVEHRDRDHRAASLKPLPKVAFRWDPAAKIAFGNHSVVLPGRDAWGLLLVREWQYRTFDHFIEKVEKQRELLSVSPGIGAHGQHKNRLVSMSDMELAAEWEALRGAEWVYDPIPS